MLTKDELERERYESPQKAQFDRNTYMAEAWERGFAEGFQEAFEKGFQQGEKIGAIHVFEWFLNRAKTPTELLAARSLEDLAQLAEELEKQYRHSVEVGDICVLVPVALPLG